MSTTVEDEAFRCGYVGLVGRPNAGKSTLLNRLLGAKLAITSAKPQTTRNRVAGVHTDQRMQAVLVDTPGVHSGWTELNKEMVGCAYGVLAEVDLVCWVMDVNVLRERITRTGACLGEAERELAERIKRSGSQLVVAVNKLDTISTPEVLPVLEHIARELSPTAAVPISAKEGVSCDLLLEAFYQALPLGAALYPEDEWAQVTERFMVSELIREQLFLRLDQELPYATFVDVIQFDESKRETKGLIRIFADILVERSSQKGIVIGKGGQMLKGIGSAARKELQPLLDSKVYLELRVKVVPDWSRSVRGLRRVGFRA